MSRHEPTGFACCGSTLLGWWRLHRQRRQASVEHNIGVPPILMVTVLIYIVVKVRTLSLFPTAFHFRTAAAVFPRIERHARIERHPIGSL